MVNVSGGLISHSENAEIPLEDSETPIEICNYDKSTAFYVKAQSQPNSAINAYMYAYAVEGYGENGEDIIFTINPFLPCVGSCECSESYDEAYDDLGSIMYLVPNNSARYDLCTAFVIPDLLVHTKNGNIIHNDDYTDPYIGTLETPMFVRAEVEVEKIYTYEIISTNNK